MRRTPPTLRWIVSTCSASPSAIGSNCRWIHIDQSCRSGASSAGAPMTRAMVREGYGFAISATKSKLPAAAAAGAGSLEDLAHHGPVALDRPRAQRRVDEPAQPRVVGAVDVDDVARHLLVQRPVGDVEELREQQPGEDRRLRAQELLSGRAIEDQRAQRRAREPRAAGSQLAHRLVPALAAQRGVGEVDLGEVELGDDGHPARLQLRRSQHAPDALPGHLSPAPLVPTTCRAASRPPL